MTTEVPPLVEPRIATLDTARLSVVAPPVTASEPLALSVPEIVAEAQESAPEIVAEAAMRAAVRVAEAALRAPDRAQLIPPKAPRLSLLSRCFFFLSEAKVIGAVAKIGSCTFE